MGDLFDAIEALECEISSQGRTEGLEEGRSEKYKEGFQTGIEQAEHILKELGVIKGFFDALLLNEELREKQKLSIEKVQKQICCCFEWNPSAEEELETKLHSIQVKSKLVLKQLKISASIVDQQVDSEF